MASVRPFFCAGGNAAQGQAALAASPATPMSAPAGTALGANFMAVVVATAADALPAGGIAHQMAASLYGAMLVFFGWNSMRRALSIQTGVKEPKPAPAIRHFRLALVTAAANPATALFFASATVNLNVRDHANTSTIAGGFYPCDGLVWSCRPTAT